MLHLLLQLLDASLDPWMSEGILRSHAFLWLPLQTAVDEVDEVNLALILAPHHRRQVLGVNGAQLAL